MLERVIAFLRKLGENDFSKATTKLNRNQNGKARKRKLIFEKEMTKYVEDNLVEFKEEYEYYEVNCCPNCGVVIDKKIESSKKCNSCNKKIIIRTNKENGRKLLLSEERTQKYDKYDEKRKEILYCDKMMVALHNMYPQYMYKFYEIKKDKPDMSVRDYTFSFENWLLNELDRKAYQNYTKYLKISDFQKRVLKCDQVAMEFKFNSNVFRLMAELTKYEKKDNVLIEMIVSLLYRNVMIAHLDYYHWEDRPYNETHFLSNIYDNGMYLAVDYMKKYNMSIDDLKKEFMKQAHPFILNILTKEQAWPLIEEGYKEYIKLQNRYEHSKK